MNTDATKRAGRPRSGRSVILTLTVPPMVAARIDASAAERFELRREAVRRLLIEGLDAEVSLARAPEKLKLKR